MVSVSQNNTPVNQHDLVIEAASREDLARAAAVVITHSEYYGKTLELSGDTPFSFADFTRIAEDYRKSPIHLQNITLDQSRQMMRKSGFGKRDLEVMAQLEKVTAEGKLYSEDHTLSQILGRPTKTIRELMEQYVR